MKLIATLGLMVVVAVTAKAAANGQLLWEHGFAGVLPGDRVSVNAIATDHNGDVLMVGKFLGTTDFGAGPVSSAGGGNTSSDGFVAKYTAAGAFVWAKTFGNIYNDISYAVAVDSANNVLVAGSFTSSVNFGGITIDSGSTSSSQMFLAKYSSAGALAWVKGFGAAFNPAKATGVGVDSSDNILLTGSYSFQINFGLGVLNATGSDDIGLAKFNSAGTCTWQQHYGGAGAEEPTCLAVDTAGNVIVGGYFFGTADLGGGNVASAGGEDIFVAKYSGVNGTYQWSKTAGSALDDACFGVAIDPTSNSVFLTGTYNGTISIGGATMTTPAQNAIFLAAYTSAGAAGWGKSFAGSAPNAADMGLALATDASGNIGLTGQTISLVNFGAGWMVGNGAINYYVTKFNNSGVASWSKRSSVGSGIGQGAAFDSAGNLWTVGTFQTSINPGGSTNLVTPASTWGGFAAEYAGVSLIPGSVSLSVGTYSIEQGGGFVPVTATRSGGSAGAITVNVATADGSALAGIDYTAVNTTLNWADGAAGPRTTSVPILDSGISTNRTFTVNISGGAPASLGPITQMTVTITPHPPPPPILNPGTLTFSAGNYPVLSTNGSVTLTVIRANSTNTETSCSYSTSNGSASAGIDYTTTTGTLSWATNENTSKTITIPILDTGAAGPDRVFTVTLSNPANGATFLLNPATVTIQLVPIVLNHGNIALSASATSVSENDPSVTITVSRAAGADGAVSVTASTANDTAIAGHDYTATTTLLTWGNGVIGNKSFTVPILQSGDFALTNRVFTVNLSGVTGGASLVAPTTETVTIIMNPPPPPPASGGIINMDKVAYSVPLTAGTVTLTVTRSLSINTNSAVSYATFDGTAKAGVDYTSTAGSLSWGVNENTTKNIVVPIINTAKQGAPINFTVFLFNPSGGASVGAALSAVSITLNPVIVPLSGVSLNGQVTVRGNVTIELK